jgi:hypothetical protein
LAEWSTLQVEAIVELLEVCLRAADLQTDNKFIHQKESMAVGSSLSPIISNIMEHYEKLPLVSAQYKLSL